MNRRHADLLAQVDNAISQLTPGYTELLMKLVQTPSQYGQEAACQAHVRKQMETLGLAATTVYSRNDSNAVNLAARIAGSGGGRSLVLNAHADVTPVEGEWKHPPFAAVVEDGILYGRGAQDDKAGIAVILLAVECLQILGIKLKGDLLLHVVVEDETTGNGSKALVDAGFGGDGVIICDGTWPERIVYAHLGQVWLDVSIPGSPVAACVEHRGTNPIYIACEFISRIRAWADDRNSSCSHFENVDKPFFVNVGSLHSGVWHGSVPALAELQIQIGFGPELEPADVLRIMIELAAAVSDRIRIGQGLLSTPACRVPHDGELIGKLKSIIERNSGKEVRTQAVTGHCDMRHFRTPDVCLYGPGAGWNAHGVDEGYKLSDLAVVARNLVEFALDWCGVES
jgi:acetylornithine deacetylase